MTRDVTQGCPACPHPLPDHDAFARRWCQASTASGKARDCICRPVTP